MHNEWYITFHGGAEATTLNNIHVFSSEGRHLRKALKKDSLPAGIALRELRGFTFGPDSDLYVANAFQDYSQILRFHGKPDGDGQHAFRDIFAQHDKEQNPGLKHPFNVVFDRAGDLFVTAQDTSVTLRYHGPRATAGKPGTPMPFPTSLTGQTQAQLHPGTFCLSAAQSSDGLRVVREALFVNDLLYVADRDGNCIRKYDPVTGASAGTIAAKVLIDQPIHLAFKDDMIYVGNKGNESIVRYDLRSQRITPFIAPHSGGLKNPAGLAFGNDGFFYVASRGSRQILRYRLEDGRPDKHPFIDALTDDPEFIEPVPHDI
jgi:hypothetical protein